MHKSVRRVFTIGLLMSSLIMLVIMPFLNQNNIFLSNIAMAQEYDNYYGDNSYSTYPTDNEKYECRTGPFEGFFVSSVEFCKNVKFDDKDDDKDDKKDNKTKPSGGQSCTPAPINATVATGPQGVIGSQGESGLIAATQIESGLPIKDLAVANEQAMTVSILLGNGDGKFGPPTEIPAANDFSFRCLQSNECPQIGSLSVAVGDFNNDSNQDLAVGTENDISEYHTISILLGNGDGTFGFPTSYETGIPPVSIAVGDFNADSNQDLAVSQVDDNTVLILLGNGDGKFGPQTGYPTGHGPVSVAVLDFNRDTNLDLAVANQGDNTVSILLGNCFGVFGPKTDYPTGHGPISVAAGYVKTIPPIPIFPLPNPVTIFPFLAVANQGDNTVSILVGREDGTFHPKTDYPTGHLPTSVAIGNFDKQ